MINYNLLGYFYTMNERIPIDNTTLSDLMSRPIIVRIVTILDITCLSIL